MFTYFFFLVLFIFLLKHFKELLLELLSFGKDFFQFGVELWLLSRGQCVVIWVFLHLLNKNAAKIWDFVIWRLFVDYDRLGLTWGILNIKYKHFLDCLLCCKPQPFSAFRYLSGSTCNKEKFKDCHFSSSHHNWCNTDRWMGILLSSLIELA